MVSLLPITARDVSVVRDGKSLLGPLDLELSGGGLTIVLGPNGAGHDLRAVAAKTSRWIEEIARATEAKSN